MSMFLCKYIFCLYYYKAIRMKSIPNVIKIPIKSHEDDLIDMLG